jgi:hypothetical protein
VTGGGVSVLFLLGGSLFIERGRDDSRVRRDFSTEKF